MTCKRCGMTHEKRGSAYPFDELVPQLWRAPYRIDPRYEHINTDTEAEKFMLRNLSVPGSRGVYKCWRAAWQKWMIIALEENPKPVIGLEDSKALGGWQKFAQANGMEARVGESWDAYQARVENVMRNPPKPKLELVG